MNKKIRWIAIGDSFTFMNNNPDIADYRVKQGYLDRIVEKIPNLELFNMGINGSTTDMWVNVNIPQADLYTILLGTNDWFHEIPLGTKEDFLNQKQGCTLGNLSYIIHRIKEKYPHAKVIVMNPVERGDFVYILNHENTAHNSTISAGGILLKDFSAAIYDNCKNAGFDCINLHDTCGFTVENAVKFKHVKTETGYQDLPWPEYSNYEFHPGEDEYPYPLEAIGLTYDGLHPSDEGNKIIAEILAKKITEVLNSSI